MLAVAAVLMAGLALWLFFSGRPPADDSPEAGFARDMSEHHAQAVQMAEIMLRRTEDEQVRFLATDILLTQQNQIGQMHGWLNVWGLPLTGNEPAMSWMGMPNEGSMPGMATPEVVSALETLPPREADKKFLGLMIEHHRAAIPMAEAVLAETNRPEVEHLANAIAASQRSEISAIEGMLRERGAQPPSGDQPGGMESMPGMDSGG